MKFITLLAVPTTAWAASWGSLFQGSQLEGGELTISKSDLNGCVADAQEFLANPAIKHTAIESAMDRCALSKQVEDKNFVCPHYRELLTAAFRREPTDREFTAESFCSITEGYVVALGAAHKVPNMGEGSGFKFKMSKGCKSIVKASMSPAKAIPKNRAPDFWYALCMNQDCAHFLPSRTRWCTQNHQPTHSQSVCEAVRLFARDEMAVLSANELDATGVCNIYDEFVEDSHINVEAYMHVVHHTKQEKVPVPEDGKRALESAKMKHEAKKHGIRDAAGEPVKSVAVPMAPASLLLALVSFAGLGAY